MHYNTGNMLHCVGFLKSFVQLKSYKNKYDFVFTEGHDGGLVATDLVDDTDVDDNRFEIKCFGDFFLKNSSTHV